MSKSGHSYASDEHRVWSELAAAIRRLSDLSRHLEESSFQIQSAIGTHLRDCPGDRSSLMCFQQIDLHTQMLTDLTKALATLATSADSVESSRIDIVGACRLELTRAILLSDKPSDTFTPRQGDGQVDLF